MSIFRDDWEDKGVYQRLNKAYLIFISILKILFFMYAMYFGFIYIKWCSITHCFESKEKVLYCIKKQYTELTNLIYKKKESKYFKNNEYKNWFSIWSLLNTNAPRMLVKCSMYPIQTSIFLNRVVFRRI